MSRRRAQVFFGSAIAALTAVAAVSAAPATLYAQIYPTEGAVEAADLEAALADARLTWAFDSELTEHERVRFTATVAYDGAPTEGVPVEVAFANDASLTPAVEGQLDIAPVTGARRYLNEGTPRPGGGLELSWVWEVVARASGDLRLILEVQPVLEVDGDATGGTLRKRNAPVEVSVNVHPHRLAFNDVISAARTQLAVTLPDEITAGEPTEVSATLPLPSGAAQQVQVDISLATVSGSRATIQPRAAEQPEAEALVRSWVITPEAEGTVDLVFTVAVSTAAGDQALAETVQAARSVTATPSLGTSFVEWMAVLGTVLAVLLALAAVADKVFGLRSKVRTWWSRRRMTRPPPTPAA